MRLTIHILDVRAKKKLPPIFSTLGGFLYISKELADLFKDNDDELAFLIAHEIAKIDHRYSRICSGLDVETQILYAKLGRPKTSQDAAKAENQEAWLKNRKKQEVLLADRYALLYLLKAGYKLESAESALKKIKEKYGPQHSTTEYLSTNPSDQERIDALAKSLTHFNKVFRVFGEGIHLLKSGDPKVLDRARVAFEKYLEFFEDSKEARNNLAAVLLRKTARERTLTEFTGILLSRTHCTT